MQTSTIYLIEASEDAVLADEEDIISRVELLAASLCQGLGADVLRTMRFWASQESLLRKYCPGSCKSSRMF